MENLHTEVHVFSIAVHGLQFAIEVSNVGVSVTPSGKASADFGASAGKFMGGYFKPVSRRSRRLSENA